MMVTKTVLLNALNRSNLYSIVNARATPLKVERFETYLDHPCKLFNLERNDCDNCPLATENKKPGPTEWCQMELAYLKMLGGIMSDNQTLFDGGRTLMITLVEDISW